MVIVLTISITSCKHQPYAAPNGGTVDTSICFSNDILPIFVSECAKSGCHDAATHEEGLILDNYEHIIRKGIKIGNAEKSDIYKSLKENGEDRMPRNAPPLAEAKIALIKKWIDGGAVNSSCSIICDSNNFTYSGAIQPLMEKYCTGCHGAISPNGNISLITYADVTYALKNKNMLQAIRHESGYSPMPQGSPQLSYCQIRQVEKWTAANMPDN